MWLTTGKVHLAELYLRTLMVFVIFIPTTFTHFILTLLKVDSGKRINLCNYVISSFLGIAAYTRLFAYDIGPFLVFPYWLKAGFLFYVHTIHFFANVIYSHYLMLRALKQNSGVFRNQVLYVLIGTAIGYSGGALNYLTWMRFSVPPFLNLLVSVYVATVAYAIIRHRLMDIEVIVKKTLVFAGLLAFVFAAYSAAAFIVREILSRYFGMGSFWTHVISIFLIVLGYDPIRNKLINLTDKFLFQKKQDFPILLNQLAKEIITILDRDKVGDTILRTLRESLRLESGVLILKNENSNQGYYILDSFNVSDDKMTIAGNHPLITYLSANKSILNLEDPMIKAKVPTLASSCLEKLHTVICIPLIFQEDLIGVIGLGKRKSDQEFSNDEVRFFPIIASQAATSLKIAQLVDALLRETELKFKAELRAKDEAKRAHYAQTVAHEIKNPLVSMKMMGSLLMTKHGTTLKKIHQRFYKGIAPPAVEDTYFKTIEAIEGTGQQMQVATTDIYVSAKTAQYELEGNQVIRELINLHIIWEAAVQDSDLKDINFHVEIPAQFKVFGNPTQIKRVLVNFVTNANDAMNGKESKVIELRCSYKTIDSQEVAYIECRDFGDGIPKGNLKKIFELGESTKSKPKSADDYSSGHGYGLYQCKEYIEEWHKGKIWAESEGAGTGAKFIFWIPMKPNDLSAVNDEKIG